MRRMPPELRELLVCPRCHGALLDDASGLRCDACRVVYPIVDDVPVLLVDEAKPVKRSH